MTPTATMPAIEESVRTAVRAIPENYAVESFASQHAVDALYDLVPLYSDDATYQHLLDVAFDELEACTLAEEIEAA